MEAKRGHELLQLWNDHEIEITKKTSNSYEVTTDDVLRAASAASRKPLARLPENKFLRALGMEEVYTAPPQTRALSLRAAENWERCPREDLAPHEAPHKQKYHKSGFSRVMLAATIANVGDPLLGSRTATAKTVGGYRVVVSSLRYRPSAPQPISPQRHASSDSATRGHLP